MRPTLQTRRQLNLRGRITRPARASPPMLPARPAAAPPPRRDRGAPTSWIVAGRLLRLLSVCATGLLALIGLLSVTRGTPIERLGAPASRGTFPAVGTPAFAQAVGLLSGAPLTPGHRVALLTDGDGTYPRLWADLRAARRSVTVQLYYGQPGAVADTMARILRDKAREGVPVLVVLDDFGFHPLARTWDDSLRAAGVRVTRLRDMRWYRLDRVAGRSHVRAVVVDGVVGYTGGFGLADYWLGDGRTPGQWRETNVRFEGPAVAQLQAAFTIAWAEAEGELLAGEPYFVPTARPDPNVSAGGAGVRAAVAFTTPTPGSTPAERLVALSIAGARRTLYVTNPYFLPDDDFRRFLVDAVARGVDVRVLTAGARTDIRSVRWASHWRYERLLRAGVRIYEYQPTMLHAKTLVADGTWAIVGSMNFDNRSLALNEESSLVILDRGVGGALDAMFRDDLRHAREIRLTEFLRRPFWHRVVEAGAALMSRIL
jgi:cardiolipin synthase